MAFKGLFQPKWFYDDCMKSDLNQAAPYIHDASKSAHLLLAMLGSASPANTLVILGSKTVPSSRLSIAVLVVLSNLLK